MSQIVERNVRHSSILYDLFDIHNNSKHLRLREDSLTDSEISRDLKHTLKALETKTLSDRDAVMLRKRRAKQLKLLTVKVAAVVLVCASLIIPSMYSMSQLDTNRRTLKQVIEELKYLRRLANAINSIGVELETTVSDRHSLDAERSQTDEDINNLIYLKHSIFSFGTLLKTKSSVQQALNQIRYKIEQKINKMSMTLQEYSILMTFLTDNVIQSIKGISILENPTAVVKFQMSQMASTALHIVSAYWTASCQNETCLKHSCEEAGKAFKENIISNVNVFIGITESLFMRNHFSEVSKADMKYLRQLRHVASYFESDGLLQGDVTISKAHCLHNTSQIVLKDVIKKSISTIEMVTMETKMSYKAKSETLVLYISGLFLSVGIFAVVSVIYHCQLRRLNDLRIEKVVFDANLKNQRFESETILTELVPSIYCATMVSLTGESLSSSSDPQNTKTKRKCKGTVSMVTECGGIPLDEVDEDDFMDTCCHNQASSDQWLMFGKNRLARKRNNYGSLKKSMKNSSNKILVEYIENVTIFKCDFIMLQELVRTFSPAELVNILTCLIEILEQRTRLYDAFVLGRDIDSFTVVSGITPQQRTRHTEIIANMALDILNSCSDLEMNNTPDSKLRMRIGIHTSSCFASLTLLPMPPRYRLHGDIMANAHHLLKTSLPNRIQISETVGHYLRREALYKIQKRGFTTLPNGRIIETQWILGRRVSVCVPNSDSASIFFPSPLQLEQKPVYHYDNEEMKYMPPTCWPKDIRTPTGRPAALCPGIHQIPVFREDLREETNEIDTNFSYSDV